MQQPEPHPDLLTNHQAIKQITRGGNQAIEDKAIEEYMKAYELGKEEAEKVFFEQFKKKP